MAISQTQIWHMDKTSYLAKIKAFNTVQAYLETTFQQGRVANPSRFRMQQQVIVIFK